MNGSNASDSNPEPGKDQTPVKNMKPAEASAGVAAGILGKPGAPKPDAGQTEAQKAEAAKAAAATEAAEQAKAAAAAEAAKKGAPAKPGDGVPDIPAQLLKKDKGAPVKSDDDFDVNKIDLEQIDEKLRPNFAKMRDKINGTEKDLAAITKERDDLKTKLDATPAKDAETWGKERTELMDKISMLNLEADPRFVAKYEGLTKPVLQSLQTMIGSYNVENLNAEEVVQFAATLSAKDRVEFLSSQLPEEIQQAALSTLLPAFSQLDIIANSRLGELQNHKQVVADLQKTGSEEAQKQLVQLRTEAKTAAVTALTESEILLQKVDGNEAWNKSVDGVMQSIDAVFATEDPKVHAEALAMSRLAPVYKLLFFKERGLREQMEQAIKDRNITLPDIGSDADKGGKPTMKLEDMTPESVAARVASGLA